MAGGGDSRAIRFYTVAHVLHVTWGDQNTSLPALVSAQQFVKQLLVSIK